MEIKPILFSTPMVQAILDGRKLQTRRIIKPQPDFDSAWKNLSTIGGKISKDFLQEVRPADIVPNISTDSGLLGVRSENGLGTGICVPNIIVPCHKGDILWVRETYTVFEPEHCEGMSDRFYYKASHHPTNEEWRKECIEDGYSYKWKPSIFMPKAACRIFLEVTNVRVERLQDISEGDSMEEGIMNRGFLGFSAFGIDQCDTAKRSFQYLWEKINGIESWKENPWVWVYDFKRVEKPANF